MPEPRFVPSGIRLLLILIALVGFSACVRVRSTTSNDPAAAGNVARAQVVTTSSPESSPMPTESMATAIPPTETAAATVAATETPQPTATSDGASPTPMPCRLGAFDDELDLEFEERDDDAGSPRNGIKLCNRKDSRLRVKGRVQLNRIRGDTVQPVNESLAWARCTDCSTISVALQMNLIKRNPSYVVPMNKAVSYNYACTRCRTIALAYQYVHQVDDPGYVPDDVRRLVNEMNRELQAVHAESSRITIQEAATRLDAVIGQFHELNQSLDYRRDDRADENTPGSDGD